MSSTTNYNFSLTDGVDLVKKENINTPIIEIDDTLKTMYAQVTELEKAAAMATGSELVRLNNDAEQWYILLGNDGIMQGGKGYANKTSRADFVYQMADTDYTVVTGKYAQSNSGVTDVYLRNPGYIVCNGMGQGNKSFTDYHDYGYMVVGRVKKPLTAGGPIVPTGSTSITLKGKRKVGYRYSTSVTIPKGVTIVKISGRGAGWQAGTLDNGTAYAKCTGGRTYSVLRKHYDSSGGDNESANQTLTIFVNDAMALAQAWSTGTLHALADDFTYTFEWGAEIEKHGADTWFITGTPRKYWYSLDNGHDRVE